MVTIISSYTHWDDLIGKGPHTVVEDHDGFTVTTRRAVGKLGNGTGKGVETTMADKAVEGNWRDDASGNYAKLPDGIRTDVKFLDEGKRVETGLKDKNGAPTMAAVFAVEIDGEEKELSVTSRRLKAELAKFDKLTGRVLKIKKKGTGTDTTYDVEE